MRKCLQRWLIGLLTSFCIAPTLVQAAPNCFEKFCNWDGCLEVGGAAVYWKPCMNRFQLGETFVTVDTNIMDDKIHTLKPDYNWGFRLWATYHSCDGCEFFRVSWTRLKGSDSVAINAGDDVLTAFVPLPDGSFILNETNVIKSYERLEYNAVPVHFGRNIACVCNSRFYAYGGARYVSIQDRRELVAVNSTNRASFFEKAELDGFGLDLGLGGEYALWCGFNFVGEFGVTAGLGEKKRRLSSADGTATAVSELNIPIGLD